MEFLKELGSKTIIKITVVPGSSKNEVIGLYGEPVRLKVKVTAPPEDGKANSEVIVLFAKVLGISKNKIEIIKGKTGKQKDLSVDLAKQNAEKIFLTMSLV